MPICSFLTEFLLLGNRSDAPGRPCKKGAILNPVNSFPAKRSMKSHSNTRGERPIGCLPLVRTEFGDFAG